MPRAGKGRAVYYVVARPTSKLREFNRKQGRSNTIGAGEGGVAVELRKSHAVALPPLNIPLAHDLLKRSQLGPLLSAFRGRPAANEQVLLDTLVKVSQMACDLPWLAELDINPLLLDEQGVLAVDARVKLRTVPAGESNRLAIRPYPAALEERAQLAGQELLLRPIRPEDGALLMAFYANASSSDMHLRFFFSRRSVPHSELARYSQIDYDREMTFIAVGHQNLSQPLMAGEVRAVCDPDNFLAEFAVQVAADWQGKGLGRVLLEKLIGYLRARGIERVVGQCLTENSAMARLARECGFIVSPGLTQGVLALQLDLTEVGATAI